VTYGKKWGATYGRNGVGRRNTCERIISAYATIAPEGSASNMEETKAVYALSWRASSPAIAAHTLASLASPWR
tara:strand:- start:99 stop:317 length:219 start_codon:yes stop_codon:yes gene_type:complete